MEPAYPKSVTGWGEREDRGVRILGEFALKKGETTQNEKVQIKLLELIPPESCAAGGEFRAQARARLQFVRVADGRILCEDVFPEHGFSVLSGCRGPKDADYVAENGLGSIWVNDINIADGWIWFKLS